ncbi:MAG: class II aldolase/adducin family protein [Candidatus Cloacimonas sp.]|jgi:rhamnulose-1-phosphate aldolase|nr:class II aldolase/adducin family protein [Candidatus Cloacimonas sp.]
MVRNNPDSLAAFVFNQIPELTHILKRIAFTAAVIHQQCWAEANAGNLSIRIGKIIKPHLQKEGFNREYEEWYLVSRSGSRFRDIAINPVSGLMLIAVDKQDSYFPAGAVPTSEWICHKAIHNSDVNADNPCLLHAHPTDIIALSQTSLYSDAEELNTYLAKILPELPLYLPRGIAISEYQTPGSQALATESCNQFSDKQALIWEKHGLLCRGDSIDQALDYLEIVNKAAKLCLRLGVRA